MYQQVDSDQWGTLQGRYVQAMWFVCFELTLVRKAIRDSRLSISTAYTIGLKTSSALCGPVPNEYTKNKNLYKSISALRVLIHENYKVNLARCGWH